MIIDIIIVLALVYAVYRGFKEGIVLQLGGLVGIVAGIWLAYRYGHEVGAWLHVSETFAYIAGFTIVLIAAILLIGLFGWLLGKIFNFVGLGFLNRAGGVVLSLAKALIILSVLLVVFAAVNDRTELVKSSHIERSRLYHPVKAVSNHVFPYFTSLKEFVTKDE